MIKSDLQQIPGIGKVFFKDFARIGITKVSHLQGKNAEKLFELLSVTNDSLGHKTSKNYLYVIRMAVYFADGGRDPNLLKWNAWKD
jgi:hypothetical protein